jgi:SAM-dependent methyltransferase
MADPAVRQLEFLNGVFRDVLKARPPRRLLVAGCSTGNGFEHIDYAAVEKVVAIDINPGYLDVLRARFSEHLDKIETICSDVSECDLPDAGFDLVHCALIFEYVDPDKTVKRLRQWLVPGGLMSVVLQMRDVKHTAVTDTAYQSLKRLDGFMKLIAPECFDTIAMSSGFEVTERRTCRLDSGKEFYVAVCKKQIVKVNTE